MWRETDSLNASEASGPMWEAVQISLWGSVDGTAEVSSGAAKGSKSTALRLPSGCSRDIS